MSASSTRPRTVRLLMARSFGASGLFSPAALMRTRLVLLPIRLPRTRIGPTDSDTPMAAMFAPRGWGGGAHGPPGAPPGARGGPGGRVRAPPRAAARTIGPGGPGPGRPAGIDSPAVKA